MGNNVLTEIKCDSNMNNNLDIIQKNNYTYKKEISDDAYGEVKIYKI